MSIQLLVATTSAYLKQQKQQKEEEAVESQQREHQQATALFTKTPTTHREEQSNYSGQISSLTSSPSSTQFAQSPKSVPFITIPGSAKRSRPPEMDFPEMANQEESFVTSPTIGSTNFSDSPSFVEGPKPKQRRYEERMSSQLGGIYISPEKEKDSTQQEQNVGQQEQSRPKIEEIVDWDEEFLEDEDELIRQAITAPIVEEPRTTPTKMDELFAMAEGKEQKSGEESPRIVELEEEEDGDDEGFIENGDEKDWPKEPSKIVLSEKLRQLIRQDRAQSSTSTNGHSPLLTRSQIRTGKELIPYVPSPLARQPSISAIPPIEEVHEGDEQVLNDEFLPDAVNSPRIEEFSGESMPPTPSTLEPIMSDDDLPRIMPFTAYCQQIGQHLEEEEEEEAMEMD